MPDPGTDPDAATRRYLRTDALRLAIKYTERVTMQLPGAEIRWPGTVIEAATRFEQYLAGDE